MDEVERQAEHDTNIAAVKNALTHLSRDELLHIAASKIVSELYLEGAHKKETEVLYATIALQDASMRHAGLTHLAEMDQRARRTVQYLIGLMPEMQGMTRSKSAKRAVTMRHESDPKQAAKALIKKEWLRRRKIQGKARWFSKFALEMAEAYPLILDPETIRKWISAWEKEYNTVEKKVLGSCAHGS